jgi:putative transposase
MRKKFTADYKAQAVLEVLRETETLTQIASKRGIHPAQLQKWRREALAGLPSVFERSPDKEKQALEAQVQELYAQLGEATSRLAWLKKKSGIDV